MGNPEFVKSAKTSSNLGSSRNRRTATLRTWPHQPNLSVWCCRCINRKDISESRTVSIQYCVKDTKVWSREVRQLNCNIRDIHSSPKQNAWPPSGRASSIRHKIAESYLVSTQHRSLGSSSGRPQASRGCLGEDQWCPVVEQRGRRELKEAQC